MRGLLAWLFGGLELGNLGQKGLAHEQTAHGQAAHEQAAHAQAGQKASLYSEWRLAEVLKTPMKLFFLLSAGAGVLALPLYAAMDDFYGYHVFLFLDLFMGSAYCGFLLTALPSWLRFSGDLYRHHLIFISLFLLGIIASFVDISWGFKAIFAFWAYLVIFCFFMSVKSRIFIFLQFILLLFLLAKFLYAYLDLLSAQRMIIHINSAAVMYIGSRIAIALGSQALTDAKRHELSFVVNMYQRNVSIFFFLALALLEYFENYEAIGFASLAAGVFCLARLSDFHYFLILKRHFILFFYFVFMSISFSYILYGMSLLFDFNLLQALHLVAFASIFLMVLIVFNVAGLRHNDLKLIFPPCSYIAFGLVFCAALLRYFDLYFTATLFVFAAFILEFCFFSGVFARNKFKGEA